MRTEVFIAGAGPSGLLLAGDLARAGVAVTVLERRTTESNLTRAFAVHARTMELLDARGLADDLIATGHRVPRLALFGTTGLDLSRLPSRFPYLLVTPQYNTEELLERRATELGAKIVRGAEVSGVRQDDTGVEVDVRQDGETRTHRAGYLVGADGVHSGVRTALGLPFPGHSAVRSVMLADVKLREAPKDVLTANGVEQGFAFVAPFGEGWYRVIAWDRERQLPDDAPVDLDEIRAVTRAALGTDYGMHDARWLSRFHSDERQAPRYRVGRVLLTGDAAHVHSPAGGMGMNTGLQDAANLGWKLAAVVRGWAPDSLLDTYESERHPVGGLVLRASGAILRFALVGSPILRTIRNALAGAMLRVGPATRRLTGTLSGLGIRYQSPRGAHPWVGARAPDRQLSNGTRLYEALRGGRFVLLSDTPAPPDWDDQLTVAAPRDTDGIAVLVRPDGYIGWAGAPADVPSRTAYLDSPDAAGLASTRSAA